MLRYEYKIKGSDANADALEFGKYIHRIFELGYKSTTFESLKVISETIKSEYKFNSSYLPKIDICLKNFLKFNATLSDTVATEGEFSVPILEDASLIGVVDRILKSKFSEEYLVIDYKTSKKEKTRLQLYNDKQLKNYVLYIHKKYNVPVSSITAGHFYPITGNFVPIKYTDSQIKSHNKYLIEKIWDIRKRKLSDLKPNQNQFCDWCEYKKDMCPIFSDPVQVNNNINEAKQLMKDKDKDPIL